MSDWPTLDASINSTMQAVFGERDPVVYQQMQSGLTVGAPVPLVAIRHIRQKVEAGAVAAVEEISINPADLAVVPQRGDVITAWGARFVISVARRR